MHRRIMIGGGKEMWGEQWQGIKAPWGEIRFGNSRKVIVFQKYGDSDSYLASPLIFNRPHANLYLFSL